MKYVLLAISTCVLCAQTPRPTYEVVSVKLNTSGAGGTRMGGLGGPRFTGSNLTLKQLIVTAYRVQDFQVAGGPGWISSDRYNIEAKTEAGFMPTDEQGELMLRALIEDRFGLKLRRETKAGPIYALVVAKDGPKLKATADQTPPARGVMATGGAPIPSPDVRPAQAAASQPRPPSIGGISGAAPRGGMMMGLGVLRASAIQLDFLIQPLMRELGRPIVNRTNLAGLYDVELTWTPQQIPSNLPPDVPFQRPDPGGPTIFTALQEQLGLRLESTTGPIETLVIEKVERPQEN